MTLSIFNISITVVVLLFLSLVGLVSTASPQDWRSRTIYQVLTDRFSRGTGKDQNNCNDLQQYCGGTWDGLRERLDYIQGMGFDAVWISPVVDNTPDGYHGFWLRDLYKLNAHFGDGASLKQLVDAAHRKGMYVMVGAVMNHVGPVDMDFSSLNPFNRGEYFHPKCQITDWNNQEQVEICRLANLPDLNQSHPFVHDTLLHWTADMMQRYRFDGIRLDTVPEVPLDFWQAFKDKAAPDSSVYTIGEVFNGSPEYNARYARVITSVLSYPLYFTIRNVYGGQQSMYQLQDMLQQYTHVFGKQLLPFLAPFTDNHDNPRFLHDQPDLTLYKNALTFSLLSQGVPIVYYGTEQGFNGGADPNNREPLWPTGFPTNTEMYTFLKTVIGVRQQEAVWEHPQVQRYADDSFYAYTRGSVFVATTNVGSGGGQVMRHITYHPYADGTQLCNVFWPTSDCVKVSNGAFDVYLDHGESKIYTVVQKS